MIPRSEPLVINKRAVFFHLLFWVVYTVIFTITDGGYNNRFDRAFYIELAHLPLRLIVVYTNYSIFFPRLLLRGKYYQYAGVTLLSLIIAAFIQRAIMFYYVSPILYPNTTDVVYFFIPYKILQAGVIINSPLVFMLGFSVLHHVFKLRDKAEQLEKENLHAELRFLRSQINPHFFFNTLNSLYGLTQERSDKAPEVVHKLSELMSFVLYESDEETIPLAKELKYIRNYIELEEVRYGDRFSCNLSASGNMDILIPPLLMLPFIENSFKHGIRHESNRGWINIGVNVTGNLFTFKIDNSIPSSPDETGDHHGLGIANVQRRLELLYPSKYNLKHGRSGMSYSVYLEIDLT